MAQGVDVRAYMGAQRDGIGRGTVADGAPVFSVGLDQAEQVWRMRRMVRHSGEIRLGEVEDPRPCE
jgi:hypothetical protein